VGVIIGMDPHKRSATIEVIDERGAALAKGRFGTDKVGYREMLGEGVGSLIGVGDRGL
jgi:transposase